MALSLQRFVSSFVYYQLILFILFALSINYFIELKYISLFAYAIFHITFIYLVFYYFSFKVFIVAFIYGVFYDIILINYTAPHLITFLLLITFIYLVRKLLFNFNPNKISFMILIIFFIMFFLEMFISFVLFNYNFNLKILLQLYSIGVIVFFPLMYFFSRLDKL